MPHSTPPTVEPEDSALRAEWNALAAEAFSEPTPPKLALPDLPEREPRFKRKFGEWLVSGRLLCFVLLAVASVAVQFADGLFVLPSREQILPITVAVGYAALFTPSVWALVCSTLGHRRGVGALLLLGLTGLWGGVASYLAIVTTEIATGVYSPPVRPYLAPLAERLIAETVPLENLWARYATWPLFTLAAALALVFTLWAANTETSAPWLDPTPAGRPLRVWGWFLIALVPLAVFGTAWYQGRPTVEVQAWLHETRHLEKEYRQRVLRPNATPLTATDFRKLWHLDISESTELQDQYETELLRLSTDEFQYSSEFKPEWMLGLLRRASESPETTRRPEIVARLFTTHLGFGFQVRPSMYAILRTVTEEPLSALEAAGYRTLLSEVRTEFTPSLEAIDRQAWYFYHHSGELADRKFHLFGLSFERPLSAPIRRTSLLSSLEDYIAYREKLGRLIESGSPEVLTILRSETRINDPLLDSIFSGPILGRWLMEFGEVILAVRTFQRDNGAWPSTQAQVDETLSFSPRPDRFIFSHEADYLILKDTERTGSLTMFSEWRIDP